MTGRGLVGSATVVLAVALAGGCAAPRYEDARSEAEPAAAEREPDDLQDVAAPVEGTPADEPEPSLAEIQRELAANNARLRELGVELEGDGLANEELGAVKQDEKDGEAKGGDAGERKSTATSGVGKTPTAKPKPGAAPREDSKPSRDKKSESKSKDGSGGALDDVAAPEPAKAAPLTPNDGARNQSAGRCQQICDLAAVSCSLGDQICELADRHPGEDDYVAACERANLDCDAAKEACDACTE